MKIFLDANVLVSVLNHEFPLFTNSARILSLADNAKFEVFTSPICLAIAFYFSEKKSGTRRAKEKISLLTQNLKITSVNEETVRLAVNNKSVVDFEDGLEYYSAIKAGCTIIVTEDVEDFYYSQIRVLNCEAFTEILQ